MHAGAYRYAPIRVDYIFLGACFGYIHGILIQAVFELDNFELTERIAVAQAWTKIMWIQNDLFARWQIMDAAGELSGGSSSSSTGRETDNSNMTASSVSSNGSGCPYLKESNSSENIQYTRRPSSIHREAQRTAASKAYKLLHLSQPDKHGNNPQISRQAKMLVKIMPGIALIEPLHDGTLEVLVGNRSLQDFKNVMQRRKNPVTVQEDYDIWQPSQEAIAELGGSEIAARTIHRARTLARIKRITEMEGEVGWFYRWILGDVEEEGPTSDGPGICMF